MNKGQVMFFSHDKAESLNEIYSMYDNENVLHTKTRERIMLLILTLFIIIVSVACEKQSQPSYPVWPTGFK